jgi:signal transduction histidine kinase
MFGNRQVGGPLVGSIDALYEDDGTTRIAAADLPLARAIRGLETDDVRAIAKRPDRAPVMLLMHGRPLRDGSGRSFGGLSVMRDVTIVEHLSQRSAALEQENEQVHTANRLKSQLLANISHELRTPLNAIIGFAELMHEGHTGIMSAPQQEFLGDILSSGRHLLQMINDLLDFAKIEANKMSFKPEVFDLGVLVEEARSVVHVSALKKRIRVVSAVSEAVGSVTLDPVRVKQVLYNYLSNAVKFTGEGGHVIIRAMPDGADDVRIEVEDTGIGIALADQGRLFAPFQQLDPSIAGHYGGSGLGLALTRRIVEAQGGSVGVRSTPGEGSVFHAILPRQTSSTASGSFFPMPRAKAETA